MEIIDKYGYLEDAMSYIEKSIINKKGWQNIVKKAGIDKEILENLSNKLKDFSETSFFTLLEGKLESIHSSIAGATAEIGGADLGIEVYRNKPFILLNLKWDIVIDDEKEDRVLMEVKIFSKNDIHIRIAR